MPPPAVPADQGLVTGEAVALDLRLAALPSRGVALGIDLLLQALLLVGIGLLAEATSLDASQAVVDALSLVVLVGVLAGYPVAWEALTGRTPGKAALGLRVVRDDGGPIGFRQAFVRGLTGAFLERPGLTLFVLPVVVSLLSGRSKRMGDLLAGTVVVQERVPARAATALAPMPPPLVGWARTLELSGLRDDLALSVRSFLARSADLTPAAREDLGSRLVAAVQAVTAPPPPPGTPGWAYLSAVLAERRRRDLDRLRPAGPYGQQPPGPYGQQPPGPYGQQPPAPFGQQQAGAPYGQQAPGQQPPAPYGQQQPSPYADPGADPQAGPVQGHDRGFALPS